MKEFFVGDYRVDMSRSQIVERENIVAVEPKALQVLLVLAEQQGQVVRHEEILRRVWPNVVVEANALQRCITLLRKAFGDDARRQQVIQTHPKIGYSLAVPVNWPGSEHLEAKPKQKALWFLAAAVAATLILFFAQPIFKSSEFNTRQGLSFNRMMPLTATDQRELFPSVSPDGQHIVFTRNANMCERELWARNIENGREYKLSDEQGQFSAPAWSPEGGQVAFAVAENCDAKEPELSCNSIRALSFLLGPSGPQSSRELLSCDEWQFNEIQWLDDSRLIYIASKDNATELRQLEINSNVESVLYSSDVLRAYSLALHRASKRLALVLADEQQKLFLLLMQSDGGIIDQVPLQNPPGFSSVRWWDLDWHPSAEFLITASSNRLFEVHLDGTFNEYYLPTKEHIYSPAFHPDGDKIVASMGILDFDIYEYAWRSGSTTSETDTNNTVKFRSTHLDLSPKIQPGNANIAFISERSGSEQLWYNDSTGLSQITRFDEGAEISFSWSPDGRAIAVVAHETLSLLRLGSELPQALELPFKVREIFQWHEQELLLRAELDGALVLLSLSQESLQHQVLYNAQFSWAQWDGQSLLLSDSGEVFRAVGETAETLLPEIKTGKVLGKFLIKDNNLMYLDADKSVWRYDFNQMQSEKIASAQALKNIHDIEDFDIEAGQLLYSGVPSARKEIVLFYND